MASGGAQAQYRTRGDEVGPLKSVAFFEPPYSKNAATQWSVRGGYKYLSLLGDLPARARVMLAMSRLPPADDPYRRALEALAVTFVQIDTLDEHRIWAADDLVRDMRRWIGEHRPSVVSNLNGRIIGYNFALAKACEDLRTPYVYRVAGDDIETRGAVFEARGEPFWGTAHHAGLCAQERYAIDAATRIIVMNRKGAGRLTRLGADPHKISICFRGVDRAQFYPAAPAPGRATKFLYVGRRSFEKGYDKLEAVADALLTLAPDIRFTFAGDFEPGERGNRHYRGFVPPADLPSLYREHDALICCSRSEGFPQVLMEAMACGLPSIISESLFSEDFTDGVDALFVGQPWQDVMAATLRLHQDEGLRATLRAGAIARADAEFDEAANQHAYHAVLAEAARG